MRAILVTHFVWPFCHTMFTPFVRAKFQRSSPAVAYARRGEKNPFATPRRADPPPSPTLQRIWTPLDTCGHPLSKSYSRVSYIILSSYLYFWTLWILLCRYFVGGWRISFFCKRVLENKIDLPEMGPRCPKYDTPRQNHTRNTRVTFGHPLSTNRQGVHRHNTHARVREKRNTAHHGWFAKRASRASILSPRPARSSSVSGESPRRLRVARCTIRHITPLLKTAAPDRPASHSVMTDSVAYDVPLYQGTLHKCLKCLPSVPVT